MIACREHATSGLGTTWQDLILYRPLPNTIYTYVDAIFSEQAIDWELI
jgi:hypothetical protein